MISSNNKFEVPPYLCPEGREFLVSRFLNIPTCEKLGIVSGGGYIYFPFKVNGKVVRWKRRSMTDKKDTRFNTLEGKEKEDFRMPFYNQQIWPTNDYLIVTEGEFDCVALFALKGCNVVSLPNGAGSIESTFRNQYEYLQKFDKIYICTDMDSAGEEAAKKAMALIPPAKYRRIVLPAKDANEWLMKNPDLEFKDLDQLMINSQCIENKAFTNMLDLDDSMYETVDFGISTGWECLDKVVGGYRKGELTVISADTGSGKSTLCVNILYNLARQNVGLWINSYEMSPFTISRKLASLVLNKKMKFQAFDPIDIKNYKQWLSEHKCFINESNSSVDMATLRKQFEYAVYVVDTNYIFIDHFDYLHSSGKKSSQLENIDDAIRGLHTLAMEFNVCVFLVVHPKQLPKGVTEVTLNDLKGSSAIKQYADNIMIIRRMDRSDPTETCKVKINICKNRLFGTEKTISLKYNPQSDRYEEYIKDVF